MSRYTPKRAPLAAGGGPARPASPAKRAKPKAGAKKRAKPSAKPGAFPCAICKQPFRTEEARATHARDAHGQAIDLSKMSAVAPSLVRCPQCAAPVKKRNLDQHIRFIHEAYTSLS